MRQRRSVYLSTGLQYLEYKLAILEKNIGMSPGRPALHIARHYYRANGTCLVIAKSTYGKGSWFINGQIHQNLPVKLNIHLK